MDETEKPDPLGRAISTAMTPEAIATRIDLMAELCELAFELGMARPTGRVAEDAAGYRFTGGRQGDDA